MRKKRTDQKGAPGICVNEKTTLEEKKNSGIKGAPKTLNAMEELNKLASHYRKF
jgi:hypothetical protein